MGSERWFLALGLNSRGCGDTQDAALRRTLVGELARSADHSAPPGRARLAPSADALAGPFARERRLADQARLGLGIEFPHGSWLLVVFVHRIAVLLALLESRVEPTISGLKGADGDSESTHQAHPAIAIRILRFVN